MQVDRLHDAAADRQRGLLGDFGQDDRKLVAAVAGDEIEAAHLVLQQGGDLDQDHVADQVAETVVGLLEVVDVDHQQRQRPVVAPLAIDLQLQHVVEMAVVADAGQAVAVGKVLVILPFPGHLPQRRRLQDAVDDQHDVVELQGLGDEIGGPGLHRLDGVLDRGEPGHDQERNVLSRFADGLDQGDAVHFRHDQVGDHQVEIMAGERLQRLGGAVHGRDRKIVEFQKILQRFPHRVVVIDDEDSFGRHGIAAVRTVGRQPEGSLSSTMGYP